MTPAADRIPKYLPSKYNDWHYKNNLKYYDDDWYGNPQDSSSWDSVRYTNPPTAQITAQTHVIPMATYTDSMNTMTMNTTSFTTSTPITVTFAGTIDQAAVDAITNQLKVSLQQQKAPFAPDPPKRRSAPREFNKYVNGSDLVEEFIRYCGTLNVRQGEVMDIPIDSFIKWLIIEACVVDNEEPEVTLELGPAPQPRCLGCGRYVPRTAKVLLHDERCAGFHFARQRKQMVVLHSGKDSGGESSRPAVLPSRSDDHSVPQDTLSASSPR